RGGRRSGTPYGGIYAETFALWMALFLAFNIGISKLVAAEDWLLLYQGVAFLGSLSALAWPLLRGGPWRQVRLDVGWFRGPRPALEPAMAVAGYAMTLPLLVLGVIAFFILRYRPSRLGGQTDFLPIGQPVHPVVQYLAGESWWGPFQVILLACLAAPIVEETMFRGVLYRHLREASASFGRALSV